MPGEESAQDILTASARPSPLIQGYKHPIKRLAQRTVTGELEKEYRGEVCGRLRWKPKGTTSNEPEVHCRNASRGLRAGASLSAFGSGEEPPARQCRGDTQVMTLPCRLSPRMLTCGGSVVDMVRRNDQMAFSSVGGRVGGGGKIRDDVLISCLL